MVSIVSAVLIAEKATTSTLNSTVSDNTYSGYYADLSNNMIPVFDADYYYLYNTDISAF